MFKQIKQTKRLHTHLLLILCNYILYIISFINYYIILYVDSFILHNNQNLIIGLHFCYFPIFNGVVLGLVSRCSYCPRLQIAQKMIANLSSTHIAGTRPHQIKVYCCNYHIYFSSHLNLYKLTQTSHTQTAFAFTQIHNESKTDHYRISVSSDLTQRYLIRSKFASVSYYSFISMSCQRQLFKIHYFDFKLLPPALFQYN